MWKGSKCYWIKKHIEPWGIYPSLYHSLPQTLGYIISTMYLPIPFSYWHKYTANYLQPLQTAWFWTQSLTNSDDITPGTLQLFFFLTSKWFMSCSVVNVPQVKGPWQLMATLRYTILSLRTQTLCLVWVSLFPSSTCCILHIGMFSAFFYTFCTVPNTNQYWQRSPEHKATEVLV